MASVNKVIVLGNLTKDPEIRYTNAGPAMGNLTVATNRKWKDKDGEQHEEAEFHRISVFGKLAEICGEYLRKGHSAYFEGRLQTRKWTDKSGVDRWTTEIVADQMQMLGGKDDSRKEDVRKPARQQPNKPDFDDSDDDIPW